MEKSANLQQTLKFGFLIQVLHYSPPGAFLVLAGVFALVVTMTFGFNAVLLLGALTYTGLFFIGKRHERNSRIAKDKWVNTQPPRFNLTRQRREMRQIRR